jgi:hypothetical protein
MKSIGGVHGRSWSSMTNHGELIGEEGEGREGAQLGGVAWGGGGAARSAQPLQLCAASLLMFCLLYVRGRREGGKRGEKEK